ncbi:unnamed protein product [Linum tenue]|uniref:RING-type domain-containing protein n=1 Tax=Linum tenue TaxID=586396 RepID=A0AAV0JRQ9_9ROSI|nr:unnamed protein product [Linum tenue]
MEYFQGLTYEHVNFIFDGEDSSGDSSNFYKFGTSQPGGTSYCDPSHSYEVHDHGREIDEYVRPFLSSSQMPLGRTVGRNADWDSHAVWQDSVDPDHMTYEELLELGEAVGSQNRGLSQELISLLPVSRYRRCIFARRKSRTERCVICQMEYKRAQKRITLPCKHIYHASCGTKWLSINKACPICYTEVFSGGASNVKK